MEKSPESGTAAAQRCSSHGNAPSTRGPGIYLNLGWNDVCLIAQLIYL